MKFRIRIPIRYIFSLMLILSILISAEDKNNKNYVCFQKEDGSFPLSEFSRATPLVSSKTDFSGVLRVLNHLQTDISKVTNTKPEIFYDNLPSSKEIVLVGTLGKNKLIDKLVEEKRLDVKNLTGKWETFIIQVIEKPFPDVDHALVIAGSDKRGTIYGIYDLSEKIGVSPWYWWADVPVKQHPDVFIKPGKYTNGEPKVKYRGIFINDEAPALSGWVFEKYGGFNSKFYAHVFELILRLKGNFLWPAMWGRAFYDDDPNNPKLADEYGVVVSTSHHEPMMRAHDEWRRYGSGPWNYEKNDSKLREFWREGVERMGNYESVVTLAMRGDGDEAMSPDANVELLERIVRDQRKILGEVTGKDVTTIPQVWALYKEVQEYYEKGMRVPDDVTLLLCDDNWGNIRLLPKLNNKPRKGGYGIYYHFDYVGAPRNYKWINTNQIERVYEQMHLAYEYGAKQIWVVNVGDIKPMEFPIEFFLDYAWDPEAISAEDLPEYYKKWSEEQFGSEYAEDIADLLARYTKFNSRRKPEMLSRNTYSLINYREFETVIDNFNDLVAKANQVNNSLPASYRDAFFHLVLHPLTGNANLHEMYYAQAKNHLYATQGRAATNNFAEKVKSHFVKDSLISHHYNKLLANGKWNHMMDQTHISYTTWQQPDKDILPELKYISITDTSEMGVSIEGSDKWWPKDTSPAVLPEFDRMNQQKYYVEIFNRGKIPFEYSVLPEQPWIKIDQSYGTIETEKRIWISVDWKNAPSGESKIPINIIGSGKKVAVLAVVKNYTPENPKGFVESNGYVSIQPEDYSGKTDTENIKWQTIPNLGRTGSGITATPVTFESISLSEKNPKLEYDINFFNTGEMKVYLYVSPTYKFTGSIKDKKKGLKYAISFDDEQPQIVNMHAADTIPDWKYYPVWLEAVANNNRILTTTHIIKNPGEHRLKIIMVDPGIVLQKIVIETLPGGVKQSYLGPPESYSHYKDDNIGKL